MSLLLEKQMLTLSEAADYMGMKKNYLYRLTSARLIPHFKPNGKMIYFDKDALISWLKSNPVQTDDELNNRTQLYCMSQGKKGGVMTC